MLKLKLKLKLAGEVGQGMTILLLVFEKHLKKVSMVSICRFKHSNKMLKYEYQKSKRKHLQRVTFSKSNLKEVIIQRGS